MTEVVRVTSQAPLLQSETSNLSQVIENTTITQMPLNGRNYQQVAMLAPGVLPMMSTAFEAYFQDNLKVNRTLTNLAVDVTPLNGRYRAMHSQGVTSFSALIARVNDSIVVRMPVN